MTENYQEDKEFGSKSLSRELFPEQYGLGRLTLGILTLTSDLVTLKGAVL